MNEKKTHHNVLRWTCVLVRRNTQEKLCVFKCVDVFIHTVIDVHDIVTLVSVSMLDDLE